MHRIRPGAHRTRDGNIAIVATIGVDNRLYGLVPGHLISTWWHPNGTHNLFRNYDLDLTNPATETESPQPSRPGG